MIDEMMNSYGYEDKGFDNLLMPHVLNEDNTVGAGKNVVSPTEPSYPFDYEDQSKGSTPMATIDPESYYPEPVKKYKITCLYEGAPEGVTPTVTADPNPVEASGSTTLTVTCPPECEFVKWKEDDDDSNPRVVENVNEAMTFTAVVKATEFTVTVAISGESGDTMGSVTVSNDGKVTYGGSCTITATENEGYHFVSWDDSNTDNPRTITNITENKTFTATFAANA